MGACVRYSSCGIGIWIALLATPASALAQAEAVTGLMDNATDFTFFWTEVGVPRGSLKPESGSSASGVGFELAFEIPGGLWKRKRRVPQRRAQAALARTCEEKFKAGILRDEQACADTTFRHIKLTRSRRDTTFEEERTIEEFDWKPHLVTFEVAVGFTQSGAFVPREGIDEMRVSVREAPAVTLYGNFPIAKEWFAGYFGARTGLVQLVGGRGYTADGVAIEVDGSTFQLGGVLGAVVDVAGLNFFAEGSYVFRHIRSLEWAGEADIGTLPRSANLGGPSVAFGVQFRFKDDD